MSELADVWEMRGIVVREEGFGILKTANIPMYRILRT